mgnify:CR=1 FL=1
MSRCEHCHGRQFIKNVPCLYCMTEEKLMNSLKRAIADSKKEGKKELAGKLQIVLDHLPEYPVMAIMEAEYLELNTSLVLMIRDSFDVLPFGDQTYKAQKKSGSPLDNEA